MLRFCFYYLVIGLVTASVTLGFHIYYRSKVNRPFSKKSLACFFPFEVLFWPLFFIAALSRGSFKPVLAASKVFKLPKPMPVEPLDDRGRIAFRQSIYNNPPFCGRYIYEYGSGFRGFNKDERGVFIFEAKEVAAFLSDGRHVAPYEVDNENSEALTITAGKDVSGELSDTQLIQRWAECAHNRVEFYSEIAGYRGEFRYIIRNMVSSGIGQSYCMTCKKHYPNSAMSVIRPRLENGRGWIIDFIQCPKEHALMDIEIMHLF